MAVLYYMALFVCDAVTTFAQQRYGRSLRHRADIYVYALVTGIISMLFFYASSGFSIVLNLKTVFYASIFAATGIAAYFVQLLVYRHMGVAEVGVITTCGKLLLSSALGILLFSEAVSVVSLLRIGLMVIAVLLLFLSKKRREDTARAETYQALSLIGLLLCAFSICTGVINTVVMKYVAIDPAVVSRDSLFFLTNAFIAAFSVLLIFIENRAHIGKCAQALCAVPGKQYITVITKTVAGSLSSLLGVLILETGAVSLYAPLSNALALLAAEAVAVFTLRERPVILPLIPAVLAMLLSFFG